MLTLFKHNYFEYDKTDIMLFYVVLFVNILTFSGVFVEQAHPGVPVAGRVPHNRPQHSESLSRHALHHVNSV